MFLDETLKKINREMIRPYFEEYGRFIRVPKETSLCNPRLSDRYVYYLAEGIASLSSLTEGGEEKVFFYFPPESLLGFAPGMMRFYRDQAGLTERLGKMPDISCGIDTKTDCSFYRMSERQFLELIQQNHEFLCCVTEIIMFHYVDLVKKIHDGQQGDARKRFARWLLTFSIEDQGVQVVPRVFSFVEIARYLDLHPVTISKLAAELKAMGAIDRVRGVLQVTDPETLYRLLEEE